MSFTITRDLKQLPSYSNLCTLAGQNHVSVIGNEQHGSFSARGIAGDYELDDNGIHGKFAGHGVLGAFSFETGKVAITVIEKPFWLPEGILKQKITEGLETLCNKLS